MEKTQKPLYYYPHYVYVNLRYLLEYKYSFANNTDLHEVYDNIYIGNISTAYNKQKLKELRIKNVITAISGMHEIYPKDFNYKLVDILDINKQNLMPVFDDTSDFIEECIKKGEKVYVHCMCGVSRSVSIVCAYLARNHQIKPLNSLKLIKEIRNVANPNPSFLQQLENYYTIVTERKQQLSIK
jgi:protein-tyrosine phosphatase